MDIVGRPERYRALDVALYAVGVAGLAMCLTLIWLSMRAVMDIGGHCAEGGPFVIETHCPDGVPLLLVGGVFGLFGFGGLVAWKGAALGSPFGALVFLAWPALFLSLGWNFLEYAIKPMDGQTGIELGWLIPGVIFVLMGGGPLLALLPISHQDTAARARIRLATSITPKPSRDPVIDAERAEMASAMSQMLARKRTAPPQPTVEAVAPEEPADLVSALERLAALYRAGDLSYLEYERAKKRVIDGT